MLIPWRASLLTLTAVVAACGTTHSDPTSASTDVVPSDSGGTSRAHDDDGGDVDVSVRPDAGPTCTTPIAPAEMRTETGKAYFVSRNFGFRGDSLDDTTRSPAELLENGSAIGPAHSLHATIRTDGAGRFSHWYNALYFSTTDGSDPRTNGRAYALRGPCHVVQKLDLPLLATSSTHFATFQSHVQRMVSTSYGIFATYLTAETANQMRTFRLVRSVDGGTTWTTLHEATFRTAAPALETDEAGNLYLFFAQDFNSANGPAFFYRFDAATGFTNPLVTQIPTGGAGKFSALYDPGRQRFYYFDFWDSPHSNFFTIDKNGQILAQKSLTLPGPHARIQYPHLKRDGARIYVAWTSQHLDTGAPSYRTIHYMFTDDGGVSWKGPNGPIAIPAVADESGPVPQIVLPDEYQPITFLSSFLPRGQYAHFFYYAYPPLDRQHYVRIDLTNGARTIDRYPTWSAGDISIKSLDGFFVEPGPTKPIFAVAKDIKNRIAILASDDDGVTWLDYAVSDPSPAGYNPYAIGGAREPGPDGYLVGTFTDQAATGNDHKVRFFRIKADAWD